MKVYWENNIEGTRQNNSVTSGERVSYYEQSSKDETE
jgi:hypothetical protein